MSLSAFLMTGHDDASRVLSVSSYREPAMQPRINYAPDNGDLHGSVPLGWSYQQTVLAFNVFDEVGTSEATMRVKIAELTAALGRLAYPVTVTVDDADPETWTCDPGAVVAVDDRNSFDLQDHRPMWAVTIPAYPIRSVA